MGEHIGIWIITCLSSILTYIGLRQNLSIRRQDLTSYYTVGEGILSGIVRTVNKIIAFKAIKINQIPDHTDKNNPKEDGNKGIFFISGFALFSNLFLPLPQQLSVSLSLLPLVDVSQFLRPRPLYKYTSPG